MHVDALTLAALADELRAELLGARVQDVIQPTPQAVALDCWGGGRSTWLLASAHPRLARLHALDRKPQKLTSEPPTFVMLLRKHLDGARVVAIQQPRWERVLELGFARGGTGSDGSGGERGDQGVRAPAVWLVIEIMGRLSNLILRDDHGMILGALRLVGAAVNRYRTIAPNEPYRPPPPQVRSLAGATVPRLDGALVTADELHAAMLELLAEPSARKRPARLADLLASTLLGFGQDLSREVAARAVGDADAPLIGALPWPAIADMAHALASLPETAAWQPTLVLAPADAANEVAADVDRGARQPPGEPIAFAVYQPRQYGAAILRPMPGVSALLAAFYRHAEWRDAVEGAKGDLRRTLTAQRDRCLRKAEILARDLASLAEADQLRTEGETLLAFQTDVPAGARMVTLDNPFVAIPAGGAAPTLTITLDPRLTAVENANRRFARYHKLRRAAAAIPPQQAANTIELARVEQLLTDLALADTTTEIAQVRAEVVEAGYLRGRHADLGGRGGAGGKGKPSKGQSGKGGKAGKAGKAGKGAPLGGAPLRRQSADGFTLLVGKNSRQNEEVTFHQASGSDLWLHARGVPGAHVIVKSGGRPVPESTLRAAAALAGYYSQSRAAGSVPVDYTEQRYVRHMKGGGPGMVIYERERTLHVAPEDVSGA